MKLLDDLETLAKKALSPKDAFDSVGLNFEWKAKANPSAIISIAEHVRELEQRLTKVKQYNLEYAQREQELKQRAEAAEEKLAEIEKIEPSATLYKVDRRVVACMIGDDLPDGYSDVFIRHAPTINGGKDNG